MSDIQRWAKAEQLFMRVMSASLALIALGGGIFGLLANPEDEVVIRAFDVVIALVLFVVGAGLFWWSMSLTRMEALVNGFADKNPSTTLAIAIMQGIFAILFGLDALSDMRIPMLLLSLLLLASAAWYVQRSQRIKQYQTTIEF